MLLASSAYVAMVSIFGPPAVGKSTLAIHVGHVLANNGISIRYVNLNEAHHMFTSSKHYTDASDELMLVNANHQSCTTANCGWIPSISIESIRPHFCCYSASVEIKPHY